MSEHLEIHNSKQKETSRKKKNDRGEPKKTNFTPSSAKTSKLMTPICRAGQKMKKENGKKRDTTRLLLLFSTSSSPTFSLVFQQSVNEKCVLFLLFPRESSTEREREKGPV